MALVTYQCCICGEHIDKNDLDPCFLTILSSLEDAEGEQLEQAFFCHYSCFKQMMDQGVATHLNFEDYK